MKKLQTIFLAFCCITSYALSNDAFVSGSESANSLLNHFKGNMDTTITSPITNGSALKSVDGESSGKVSLTCNGKSVEFLNIAYTGSDFINISVSMDTNGNGIKKSHYSFSGINNICSNGFARCSSNGSSKNNNCRFYAWESASNSLKVKEILEQEALSCYCISNACGGLARNAKERILKDIGGGLISTLAKSSSKFIVGGSEIKNDSLVYYGSNAEACEYIGEMPNVNRGSSLTNASTKLASEQSGDENSVYSIFQKSTDNNTPLDKEVESSLKSSINNIDNSLTYKKNATGYDFSYVDSKGNKQSSNYQNQDINEILYCEIEYSEVSPTLFSDNTIRGKTTNSNTTTKTAIKECLNNRCPLSSGEKIKHQCGKIDDFAETIGILSGVNEVMRDMVCAR